MTEYDITAAFKAIEDELIHSMIYNMERHKVEEEKEGIQWTQWQVEQLKALEQYKVRNQKKYSKQFQDLNKRISVLLETANKDGNMEQEAEILEAIKNGFEGYKKASKTMQAEFFKINERKLEALIKATTEDMEKAETAILRMANDKYRSVIFNAQVYANTGAGTYEKAVDMATKDMLTAGLNCVEYSNGARHRLEEYADMAIRTASKRAYLQGEGAKRQDWGVSLVIMNKRGNPCPKCIPWVGKVLIDDVWSGGKADDDYPLMSYAIAKGLYHPRCKDSHTTYFKGISTADDTWTVEELEEVGLSNKKEARKQYAERQAEKYERLAKYSIDEDNKEHYSEKSQFWRNMQKRLDILLEHEPLKFYQLDSKYQNVMADMLESADDRIQAITAKYLDNVQFINLKAKGGAVSTPRGIRINLLDASRDKRGAYTSVFHEIGHAIDKAAGRISHTREFGAAIKKDFEDVVNAFKFQYNMSTEKAYIEIGDRLQEDIRHSVSDIVSGITQNKCVGKYNHTTEYWEKPYRLEREAFAHFYEAYARNDIEKMEMLKQMFPEAVNVFFKLLEDA